MIVGFSNVYAFGVFCRDEILVMNVNLTAMLREDLRRLVDLGCLPAGTSVASFFPVSFETVIRCEPYVDISGTIDLKSGVETPF